MPYKFSLGWKRQGYDPRDMVRNFAVSGTPFPASFILPLMSQVPNLDQGGLGCHDDKTEVLTDNGWVRWQDYGGSEALGTMNPATGMLEFQSPTALHRYNYNGPLHYSEHDRLDFAVTPNHRMYVRKWDERKRTLSDSYRFAEAGKIGWYCSLPHAPSGFVGTELETISVENGPRFTGDDFIAMVAMVISCGWVGGAESTWDRVSFCCFRSARIAAMRGLAHRLGFREYPSRPGVFERNGVALADWFRSNAFVDDNYKSASKKIPDIIKLVSGRQVGLFLESFGDQHINERGSRQFYSTSRRMIDDLQELLLRTGKRSSIYERDPRDAVMPDGRVISADNCGPDLTLTEWNKTTLSLERKKNLTTDHYKGEVYCATVPNGLLVTRRNGSVLVSGNSCGPNTLAECLMYDMLAQGGQPVTPSRLFSYYITRQLMGTVNQDSGVDNRTMLKAANQSGFFVPESGYPYSDDAATYRKKPPQTVYDSAAKNQIKDYALIVQSISQMKAQLFQAQRPFVFGFDCYQQIMSDQAAATGDLTMPGAGEQSIGGHDVTVYGWDDNYPWQSASGTTGQGVFFLRNHWKNPNGQWWGKNGNGTIPYPYAVDPNRAGDFWGINTVPNVGASGSDNARLAGLSIGAPVQSDGQGSYYAVKAGDAVTAQVAMTNNGSTDWQPLAYCLGVPEGPPDGTQLGWGRADFLTVVPQGNTITINVPLKIPANAVPGTTFYFLGQMTKVGVSWFGDKPVARLVVVPGNTPPPSGQKIYLAQDLKAGTYGVTWES